VTAEVSAAGRGRPLIGRPWQVLLVTAVAVFMSFLDVTIVNIAFPDIADSFPDSSLSQLSWILNTYAIVFAAALVPAGRLADRFGRRRFFFLGLLVFLAASVASGAAGSVEVLIGARAVQALGGAMLVPASLGLLLPEFPLERRATATALWGATGAVAAAAGPSLGGLLVDWQGWRAVFFVLVMSLLFRSPVLAARATVAVDHLSGGRVEVALGVGDPLLARRVARPSG
jgi:MFS family permease